MDKAEARRTEDERGQEEGTNPPQAAESSNSRNNNSKVTFQNTDTQIRMKSDNKPDPTIETVPKDEIESGMELSKALEFANKMHWIRLVNESVHSSDDEDIGDMMQ